jgi:haloalkane dehalogenase
LEGLCVVGQEGWQTCRKKKEGPQMFSTEELPKKFCDVHGKRMAYVELGSGAPVVFLHGNPTSSYIWRNIMPMVAQGARCIAPDLIGMGDSEKLEGTDPARYGFVQYRRYVEGLLEKLGITDNLVLVGEDWGGALSMDWACRHPGAARGIVYFETQLRPRNWDEFNPAARRLFERLRSPEGEEMVLQQNVFVESLLPQWIIRPLSDAEMAVYRRPFLTPGEDRRAMLTFPREILLGGEPKHMLKVVQDYAHWMATSDTPKLFINGDPGAIIIGNLRDYCRRWKNQREVTVRGRHHLQEDSPREIAQAIVSWLASIENRPSQAIANS